MQPSSIACTPQHLHASQNSGRYAYQPQNPEISQLSEGFRTVPSSAPVPVDERLFISVFFSDHGDGEYQENAGAHARAPRVCGYDYEVHPAARYL